MNINETRIKAFLEKLPSWKAPGPNGLLGFWIKNPLAIHSKLYVGLY